MKKLLILLCGILLITSAGSYAFTYKFSKDKAANANFKEGVRLSNGKRYADAIPYFEKAVQIDPEFAHAYFELAFACQYSGDNDSAITYYTKGLDNDPDFPHAYIQLAILYAEKKDLLTSYEYLKEGKKRFPKDKTIDKMLVSIEKNHGYALGIAEQAKKDGRHIVVGQVGKGVYVGPQYYEKGEIPSTPVEQKLFDEYKAKVTYIQDNNVPDNEARAEMILWYKYVFKKYNTDAQNFNAMLLKMAYGEIPPDSYVPPSE